MSSKKFNDKVFRKADGLISLKNSFTTGDVEKVYTRMRNSYLKEVQHKPISSILSSVTTILQSVGSINPKTFLDEFQSEVNSSIQKSSLPENTSYSKAIERLAETSKDWNARLADMNAILDMIKRLPQALSVDSSSGEALSKELESYRTRLEHLSASQSNKVESRRSTKEKKIFKTWADQYAGMMWNLQGLIMEHVVNLKIHNSMQDLEDSLMNSLSNIESAKISVQPVGKRPVKLDFGTFQSASRQGLRDIEMIFKIKYKDSKDIESHSVGISVKATGLGPSGVSRSPSVKVRSTSLRQILAVIDMASSRDMSKFKFNLTSGPLNKSTVFGGMSLYFHGTRYGKSEFKEYGDAIKALLALVILDISIGQADFLNKGVQFLLVNGRIDSYKLQKNQKKVVDALSSIIPPYGALRLQGFSESNILNAFAKRETRQHSNFSVSYNKVIMSGGSNYLKEVYEYLSMYNQLTATLKSNLDYSKLI